MRYSLPWGSLPAEARVGESFDEPIRLYRGDKLDRLAEAQKLGILSTALAAGELDIIYNFGVDAETQDQWLRAVRVMNGHISMSDQGAEKPTPFVSVSPHRAFTERFAMGVDDAIAEIEVPASRLIAPFMDSRPGYMPNELLVVSGILPEEVIAIYPTSENS